MLSFAFKNISPPFFSAALGLCILILINGLELKTATFEASFLTNIADGLDSNTIGYVIFINVLIIILTFAINIFIHWKTSQLYRQVLRNILFDYLTLKHSSFARIGIPSIQYLISLRSSSFCGFLEKLTIRIAPKIIFLGAILYSTLVLLDSTVAVWILILFSGLIAVIFSLQFIRGYFRIYVNSAYEESNTVRAEILDSYERIHSYNTLENELNQYSIKLRKYVLYKQIFNIFGHVVGFILSLSLLGITRYVWMSTLNSEHFGSIVLLYEELKDVMCALITDIDQLIIEYTNFTYTKYGKDDKESAFKTDQAIDFQREIRADKLSVVLEGHSILKNITFVVKKGERIAITGINGSGKSTLINALTGNIEYEGSLKIDDVEIRDLSRKTISNLMSYVPQRACVFNKSIQENLEIARDTIENIELVETCKAFECHEIFRKIGYSKVLGNGGRLLSGGQRQRVILLGSIIRGCKILVLDGSFTGLDQRAEDGFVDRLRELKGNTLLCCTQNVKSLDRFDSVVFVNDGVCEKGSYEELLKRSKAFRVYCKGNEEGFNLLKMFGRAVTKLKA